MATVIARIFDYSLDGVIADEGSSFFGFCRDLPDDPGTRQSRVGIARIWPLAVYLATAWPVFG